MYFLLCKLGSILFEHLPNIQSCDIIKIYNNLSQSSVFPKPIACYSVPREFLKFFPPILLIVYSVKYLLILFEAWDTHSALHGSANVVKYAEKSGPPRKRGQPWLSLIQHWIFHPALELRLRWSLRSTGSLWTMELGRIGKVQKVDRFQQIAEMPKLLRYSCVNSVRTFFESDSFLKNRKDLIFFLSSFHLMKELDF